MAPLFAPDMAATTMRITLVNLLATMAAYYVLSWLPQMVADAGFPATTASLVSVAASLVGVAAGLSLGALAVLHRTGPTSRRDDDGLGGLDGRIWLRPGLLAVADPSRRRLRLFPVWLHRGVLCHYSHDLHRGDPALRAADLSWA